jgi:hypothetical protein
LSITGIARAIVLEALRAGGVTVSPAGGDEFTLEKDGVLETLALPDPVERRMLFRFQYRYKVPIHWFFNPDQIPK